MKCLTVFIVILFAAFWASPVAAPIAAASVSAVDSVFADTSSADTSSINDRPSAIFGIPQTFSLHEKRVVSSIDSLYAPTLASLSLSRPSFSGDEYGNLTVSGYKSFGASVGELGEVNLEQGLEVTIEGEIRPGTTISAYLSDEGSTLDGSTREISEFDMVNVTLTNDNFTVTAGDQFAVWPEDGMLSGRKKIVGISATVTPRGGPVSVNAFGAFSGGSHTVQTLRGREGIQGPYYLTGRGEANIITPVDGTVKVRINGKDMVEGQDEDFTVDYDIGAVTFNPRILVRQDDFIRIEYEYKSFDYRRTFVGGGAEYSFRDSVFTVRGNLWSESDDKNHPIETQLGEREREALRNSGGGSVPVALSARPVHPQDVAGMSVYHPLYKKAVDAASGDTILVYTPYDPARPDDIRGFYTAWFTAAQAGTVGADYVVDSSVARGQFVYRYAGRGQGDHTALAPITAPARETAGEFEARLRLKHIRASLSVAGKEVDDNLFSNIGDDDNLSSAVIFKLGAGEKRIDRRSVWAEFDYRFRSRNFTNEIFSADERGSGWDVGVNDAGVADGANITDRTAGRQFQSWEATVGGAIVAGAAVHASGGQAFIDSLKETEKISGGAELRFMRDILRLDFGGTFFKHHLSDMDIGYRRQSKFTARPSESWNGFIGYGDEWRVDTAGRGGGHISGTAEVEYAPANLRQSVSVAQYRRGDNFLGAVDTGYAVTWEQSLAWSPIRVWRMTGDSRFRFVKNRSESATSTFLMSAISEVDPTAGGFSSRQDYRINQELSSRFEQKMFYIGRGLGTHAFDSTLGEFRPSANGDHVVQEVEIFDNTGDASVRKTTFNGDWHFKPTKKISGILNDLTWSGVLSVEEHIEARNRTLAAFVPGYLSLFPGSGGADPGVSGEYGADSGGQSYRRDPHYADMSYRQDIDYRVSGSIYRSRLYLTPGMRLIREHRENTFETALLIERKKNLLTLSAEPKVFSIGRKNLQTFVNAGFTGAEYDYRDVSVEFVQSREFRNLFEFYVRERAGRIFDAGDSRVSPIPADSGVYFQIRPGITYRPVTGGMAELAYTFSYVPYADAMDYRMAGGFSAGLTHVITLHGDIRMGDHFNLSGLYRGEVARRVDERKFGSMTHVFSLLVKAFL